MFALALSEETAPSVAGELRCYCSRGGPCSRVCRLSADAPALISVDFTKCSFACSASGPLPACLFLILIVFIFSLAKMKSDPNFSSATACSELEKLVGRRINPGVSLAEQQERFPFLKDAPVEHAYAAGVKVRLSPGVSGPAVAVAMPCRVGRKPAPDKARFSHGQCE